jgi:hypothetical protein
MNTFQNKKDKKKLINRGYMEEWKKITIKKKMKKKKK